MKFLVAFAFLIVAAVAAPANPESDATIVTQNAGILPQGGYEFSSKTSNGIEAEEKGELKANPAPKSVESAAQIIAVSGQFSYVGPDGVTYRVTYVADENGYRPEAAHLPTPPPTPL